MKKLISLATLAAMSVFAVNALAQGTDLPDTQVVCQSSKYQYDVDPVTTDAKYEWKIVDATATTDYTITYDDNTKKTQATIQWVSENTTGWQFWQREISKEGCIGDWKKVTVKVNPKPEVGDANTTLCSAEQGITAGSTTIDTFNQDLPVKDKNNVDLDSWDVALESTLPTGVTQKAGTTLLTTKQNFTSKGAIKDIAFENDNTDSKDVILLITPHAGECVGEPYKQKITVLPKVNVPKVKYTLVE